MNYEEKYNEILEWARKNKARLNGVPIEEVLPELAESDDERIRRKMIEHFKAKTKETWCNMPVKDIIAYLEKQKEQKPADLSEMMVHKEPYIAPVPTPMVADEQKPVDYDAELEKCKHNFLYFWDKYVTVKLKPAKWSKEDEEMLQSIIKDFRDGNISSIGQEQWLKSLPERFNLQSKQEWSEEDDRNRDRAIFYVRHYQRTNGATDGSEECINWIKSLPLTLKKRNEDVAKLCSNEWSEEDEKMFDELLEFLNFRDPEHKYSNWLKSLRPQYHGDVTMTEAYKMGLEAGKASHWKPSEEHLSALLALFNDPNNIGSQTCQLALSNLYDQLKKL